MSKTSQQYIMNNNKKINAWVKTLTTRFKKLDLSEEFFLLEIGDNKIDVRPYLAMAFSCFKDIKQTKVLEYYLDTLNFEDMSTLNIDKKILLIEAKKLNIGLAWFAEIKNRIMTLLALKESKKAARIILAELLLNLGFNVSLKIPKTPDITNREMILIIACYWIRNKNLKIGKENLMPYIAELKSSLEETLVNYDKKRGKIWYDFLIGKLEFEEFLEELKNVDVKRVQLLCTEEELNTQLTNLPEHLNVQFINKFIFEEFLSKFFKLLDKNIKDKTCITKKLEICVYQTFEQAVVGNMLDINAFIKNEYFNNKRITTKVRDYRNLKNKFQKLENENEKKTTRLKELEKENKALKTKLQHLENENQKLCKENEELTETLNNKLTPLKEKYNKEIDVLKNKNIEIQKELEILKRKYKKSLNKKETLQKENEELKNEYEKLKELYQELEKLKLSSSNIMDDNIPIDFIIKEIKNRNIVIIGGAPNLEKNLKLMGFEKIKFFTASNIPSVDKIENCECIVFITSYVPHSGTDLIRKSAKKLGIKIINFNERNIESMCRRIFEEITKENN